MANRGVLTLILDKNLLAEKLFFDINGFNIALDKFESSSYPQTVMRTYEIAYAIEKIQILLSKQCVESWKKACKMNKKLDKYDFRDIIDNYLKKWSTENDKKNER